MKDSPLEIVILKPTQVFLSFLSSQLPDIDLPNLKLLQTDTTAYVISKQKNDEETLAEIERLFPLMFRHEIARWLGDDAYHDIQVSFLDFLCCFKFELHSQVILMENSINQGQQLLCVKPKSVLLQWMKSSIEEQNDDSCIIDRITLSQITENSTVLIKNFQDLTAIKPFIQKYFRPLFKTEMLRMSDKVDLWPKIESAHDFSRFFFSGNTYAVDSFILGGVLLL